jgi:hypothetical protein
VCPKWARLQEARGADGRLARQVAGTRGKVLLTPFAFGYFLAIDRNISRRLDADTHLTAVYRHHRDFDVISNAQRLSGATSEYQHGSGSGKFASGIYS